MAKLKNLFLRVMSWSLRLTSRNLEIVEKDMTRLMLNLLEQKNNYEGCPSKSWTFVITRDFVSEIL